MADDQELRQALIILGPLVTTLVRQVTGDEDEDTTAFRVGGLKVDRTASGFDVYKILSFSTGTDITPPVTPQTIAILRRIEKRVAAISKGLGASVGPKSVKLIVRPLSSTKAALGVHVHINPTETAAREKSRLTPAERKELDKLKFEWHTARSKDKTLDYHNHGGPETQKIRERISELEAKRDNRIWL
jgi:hypothetical protein